MGIPRPLLGWRGYEALEDEAGLACPSRIIHPLFTNLQGPLFPLHGNREWPLGPRGFVVEECSRGNISCLLNRRFSKHEMFPREHSSTTKPRGPRGHSRFPCNGKRGPCKFVNSGCMIREGQARPASSSPC